MSLSPEFPRLDETFAKPEALLRVPVGFASPLWGLFATAAVGGSAWWWMTRWARPENLEALFGAAAATADEAAKAETALIEAPAAAAATVAPAAPPRLEAVADAVAAVEEIIEPPALDAPVGGEAAPIAPAVAAAAEAAEPEAAAKPRTRRPEPKPE